VDEPTIPPNLVEGRRTPLFDVASLPAPLAESHRTAVWAELHVVAGSLDFVDLEGEHRRNVRLEAGDTAVIPPQITHHIEPSTDAALWVQFYREPDAPPVPEPESIPANSRRRVGPWEHRNRDLDDPVEILELVTRQYSDVVQDELLAPYFDFGTGDGNWQAHIRSVADYWNHVVLLAPDYEIDVIESHRSIHEEHPFTPDLFDRWLEIFTDTVDGGWRGPNAERAKKRATGMAWAMAQRFLGKGAYRPPDLR
jgi:hemoglobin